MPAGTTGRRRMGSTCCTVTARSSFSACERSRERTVDAARVLDDRLGLTLDPERRRTLALTDGRETVWIETRLVEGRSLQRILVPGAPLVHGEAGIDGLLREGGPVSDKIDASSGIVRWTSGLNFMPSIDYVFRFQFEYWRFTDFDGVGVFHLGVVTTY